MKKLIAVLTLFLAFSVGANAQDSKLKPTDAARQDAVKLTQLVALTPTEQENFARLFEMKHKTLSDATVSVERKKEMSRIVEMKIRASLNADQLAILDQNPEVLAELTGAKASTIVPDKK